MKKLLLILSLVLLNTACHSKEIQLTTDNTFSIRGAIDASTFYSVVIELKRLNSVKTDKPIYLYLNSPGGEVGASEAIIELALKSRRVVHTVSTMAASAAFNIVQALGNRYITYYAQLLTHNAAATHVILNNGIMPDLLADMRFINGIYERTAKRIGMFPADYQSFMAQEVWVKGENNLIINTADKIVEVACTKEVIFAGNCPN